jgi:hypothetical protein
MPKFLNNVDLAQYELQNARVQNLATAPGTPVTGQVYYDTALGRYRIWNGTLWLSLIDQAYVDSVVNGLDWKQSCRAGTTANITLTGTQTVDGVAVVAGDRVLVKSQTTASANGIYVVAAGAWARAADAAQGTLTANAAVYVSEGTTLADTQWQLQTNDPITVGTTALTWAQIGAGTSYSGTTGQITVSGNTIGIDATYVGQASITTLGTITTGTWQGTAVAVGFGGTGSGTAAGARTNLGAVGKYTATIGDGAATTYTITQATHGLAANGSMQVQVFDATSGAMVWPDISINNTNGTVTFTFATAPATNAYRVVLMG